jgi:hypothetical protein
VFAETENPLNGAEILSGVARVKLRPPVDAIGEIEMTIGRLVAVTGEEIAAEIPGPLNMTDVTPERFVPVIIAAIVVP